MIKQLFFLALFFFSIMLIGQNTTTDELPIKYNQRLKQIGYEAKISISGDISDEEIYHRTIHWFRDEYQKVRKVINLKDTIKNCDSTKTTGTAVGLYQLKKNKNGSYRINGRYIHPHRYKRIGSNNHIDICGNIELLIDNGNIMLNFSNLKLPFFAYLPIEDEVLKPGTIKFKRKYKKLKSEIGRTNAEMVEDLKFWIENYDDIVNDVINWRNFEDISQ